MIKANKAIQTKIDKLESGDFQAITYISCYKELSLKEAEGFLSKTFDVRRSLEEKSKINVLGITISVAVITGLSEIFINNYTDSIAIKVLLLLLAIYALYTVILATSLNLLVLGEHNRVFDIHPRDMLLTTRERIESVALYTELNMNLNVKRNNFLYSSYGLIVRFLIILSIIFFLMITPKVLFSNPIENRIYNQEDLSLQVLDNITDTLEQQEEILEILKKTNSNNIEVINELKVIKELQNNIQRELDSLKIKK